MRAWGTPRGLVQGWEEGLAAPFAADVSAVRTEEDRELSTVVPPVETQLMLSP
jgi:hypothetical protein